MRYTEERRAYKLLRLRKNGELASPFINRRPALPLGVWLQAFDFRTKGFAHRPGWHCCHAPEAPHIGMAGRVWAEVVIRDYYHFQRPKNQGGLWFIAEWMRIERVM